MKRSKVYKLVDGERDYQETRWEGHLHSPEEWILYIDHYVSKAKAILASEGNKTAIPKSMEVIRKITAMGVAAMEQIKTPAR